MNYLLDFKQQLFPSRFTKDYSRIELEESIGSPLLTVGDGASWGKQPSAWQRRRVAVLMVLAIGVAFWSGRKWDDRPKEEVGLQALEVKSSKVVIQLTQDNGAGIGSVIQQMYRSQVFAAALGAEMYAVESIPEWSEHKYDAVGMLNEMRSTNIENAELGRVCKISRYMSQDEFLDFTDAACEAVKNRRGFSFLTDLQKAKSELMQGCGVIINDLVWDWSPHFCVCTWRMTSKLLGYTQPRIVPEKVSVGLHIRWGDMATGAVGLDIRHEYRSILPSTANKVVAGLQECLGALDLKVYMETHNDTILSELNHPYTLVDSGPGNDILDLRDLASNQVLIVAGSGYTMIGHQISRGGITIVPNEDPSPRWWGSTGTNQVMLWKDLYDEKKDCAKIKARFEKGLRRSGETMAEELRGGEDLVVENAIETPVS